MNITGYSVIQVANGGRGVFLSAVPFHNFSIAA
jgi:hypothetical protein